jgi:RimJ/RimL family protein N-acetyltransferase
VIELRRAAVDDVGFLVELYNDAEVEPFLGGRQVRDREGVAAEVERSQREPQKTGRMIIEVDGERAGAMAFDEVSDTNRIAHLGGLAVDAAYRGRGVADEAARLLQRYLIGELGFHRLELLVYGFNERAIRHAERVGYVREGVKRRAYLRHGEWQDAVMFALLSDDLELEHSPKVFP